jgi:predicted nucleotidyltransferase
MGRTLQLGNTAVDEAALTELCLRYHVRELSVFGSAARGDMRPNSDIDLLVEFLPDAEVDLVDHAGLMLDLALIRASVLEEARLVYAA